MPSILQRPNYEDFHLRFSLGLWLHSSRWETADYQYFAKQRQSHPEQILALPKLYRQKRRVSPTVDGFWLFKLDESSEPLGWAELQSFPSKNFGKGILFYGLSDAPHEPAREGVIALASLIFTLSRHDHVQIVSLFGEKRILDYLSQFTGMRRNLLSWPKHSWNPEAGPARVFSSLEADRSSWRSCEELQPAIRQLKHIELRVQRIDAKSKPKPKKKRPFLIRLFKPKIDDSLF